MVAHCAVISLWALISHSAVISQSAMMARLQCQAQTSVIQYLYLSKESDILFCLIAHANLGQLLKPGTDFC